jgi:EmrB/QacA subfamily drug resistance transporter
MTGVDRRWLALGLLAVTQFMVILDQTVVTIALPSMGSDLGVPQAGLSWIVNAYVLAFGGLLMLGGRACDLLGRRRILVWGLALFAGASLVGGFAPNLPVLVCARVAQGIGAALLSPAALAALAGIFPAGPDRNRAMGIWAGAAGSGGAVGVLLGGLLTSGAGWHWVFWINVPVGVIGAALAPLFVDADVRAATRPRLDLPGAISVTVGATLLVFGFSQGETAGWASPLSIGSLVAAVAALALFVVVELRSTHPLMSLRIFRIRPLAVANAAMVLFAAGIYALMFFLSLWLQQVLGYSAIQAGLAYIPLAAGLVFGPIGGRLLTRIGPRATVLCGLVLATVGVAWFTRISVDGGFWVNVLVPSLFIASGGQFTVVGLTVSAVGGVDERDQGAASGVFNTAREIGGALGVGVLAAVAVGWTGPSATPATLTAGFQAGLVGGLAFVLLALVLVAAFMPRAAPVPALAEAN